MNLLDENIIDSQRQRLRQWRIAVRQIGHEVGRPGMKDHEIIALLHRLSRPTFFTRDDDYFAPRLCHTRYCLVYLAVAKDEVAPFVRRFLRGHSHYFGHQPGEWNSRLRAFGRASAFADLVCQETVRCVVAEGRHSAAPPPLAAVSNRLAGGRTNDRGLLRHREFDTVAKRMGVVARISHADVLVWRVHVEHAVHIAWDKGTNDPVRS